MLPNKKVELNSKNKEKFKRNFSAASRNKTTEIRTSKTYAQVNIMK